jgi:hypothetical protein
MEKKSASTFVFSKAAANSYAGNSSITPKNPSHSGNSILDLIA